MGKWVPGSAKAGPVPFRRKRYEVEPSGYNRSGVPAAKQHDPRPTKDQVWEEMEAQVRRGEPMNSRVAEWRAEGRAADANPSRLARGGVGLECRETERPDCHGANKVSSIAGQQLAAHNRLWAARRKGGQA